MKLAHHYMRVDGLNKSQALKLAWSEAKRSEFYIIVKRVEVKNTTFNLNSVANTVSNYYANNAYNGD